MRKFFRLHDYSNNMKSRIDTFSLKGKTYIWWEDMNNFIGIHEEEFAWSEFERLLKET